MARVLLLLVLASSPGGVPTLAHARDCNAVDVVLEEGQTQVIAGTTPRRDGLHVSLYMMPEKGFEGVRLDMHGRDGIQYTAWFPAKSECLTHDDTWYQVNAETLIGAKSRRLYLFFESPGCLRTCIVTNTAPHGLYNLSVVAYGPSRWRKDDPPRHCDIITLGTLPSIPTNHPTCSNPPTTTTTTPTTQMPSSPTQSGSATIPIAVLSSVVVVLSVVIVVLVVYRMRSRATSHITTPSQPSQPASESYIVENLYESLDQNHHKPAASHVTENDLYEPFDKYHHNPAASHMPGETPQVTENDLYEPFDKYHHNPAASHVPGETPQVTENDLYEPFSSYGHGHTH